MQLKNDIEKFDKYKKNDLSERERADFEAQLTVDSHFKEAFEDYQMMVEGIRNAERKRLKQELLASQPLRARRNVRSIARHWGKVGIAASLAILVSFGIYFCTNSNERIYAQFDLGRSNNLMNFGTTDASDAHQLFDEAMSLKTNGELNAAVEKLEQINDKDTYQYFLAQYNQALIYIKLNENVKAREILKNMIDKPGNHYSKDKAKSLLKALNRSCFFKL